MTKPSSYHNYPAVNLNYISFKTGKQFEIGPGPLCIKNNKHIKVKFPVNNLIILNYIMIVNMIINKIGVIFWSNFLYFYMVEE